LSECAGTPIDDVLCVAPWPRRAIPTETGGEYQPVVRTRIPARGAAIGGNAFASVLAHDSGEHAERDYRRQVAACPSY
jgi:hypothetical protein